MTHRGGKRTHSYSRHKIRRWPTDYWQGLPIWTIERLSETNCFLLIWSMQCRASSPTYDPSLWTLLPGELKLFSSIKHIQILLSQQAPFNLSTSSPRPPTATSKHHKLPATNTQQRHIYKKPTIKEFGALTLALRRYSSTLDAQILYKASEKNRISK